MNPEFIVWDQIALHGASPEKTINIVKQYCPTASDEEIRILIEKTIDDMKSPLFKSAHKKVGEMKLPRKLCVDSWHMHPSNIEFITTVPTRALINFVISRVNSFDELVVFAEYYKDGLKWHQGVGECLYDVNELINAIVNLVPNKIDNVAVVAKIAGRNSIDISKFQTTSGKLRNDYEFSSYLSPQESDAMRAFWLGFREIIPAKEESDWDVMKLEVSYEKLRLLAKSLHGCPLTLQQYDDMAEESREKQLKAQIQDKKERIRKYFPLLHILEEKYGQGFDILFLHSASVIMDKIKGVERFNEMRAPVEMKNSGWKMLAEARQEFESFTTYNKTDVYNHLLDFYLFEHGSYLPNAPKGTSKKIGELTPFIKDLWECCESANNRKDDIWKKGTRLRGAGFSKQ
jgi:hypothetical protein